MPVSSAFIKIATVKMQLQSPMIVSICHNLQHTFVFPTCDLHIYSSGLYGSLASNEQIPDPLGQSEPNDQVKMNEFLINIMTKCIMHKDPHQV